MTWPAILLFAAFSALGLAAHGGPLPGDAAIRALVPPSAAYEPLSALVSVFPWTGLVLATALVLWMVGRRAAAVALLIADPSAEATVLVTKLLVDRTRPVAGLANDLVTSASYPSGHIVRASVTIGVLFAILVLSRPRLRAPVAVLAAAFLVTLGLARIASGEHWPSDVLGGYLLAAAWVSAVAAIVPAGPRLMRRTLRVRRLASDRARPPE